MFGPILDPIFLAFFDVSTAIGGAILLILVFRLPKVEEIIFPFNDNFNHLIEKWDVGNGETKVLSDQQINRRRVEAEALKAMANKGIANGLLLISFSILLFIAIWWYRSNGGH